jgi:DNA-binding NarL/FixJ family response regulator
MTLQTTVTSYELRARGKEHDASSQQPAAIDLRHPTPDTQHLAITVLLADDQPSVLQALRECFALEPELRIVGEAGDGKVALALAQRLHPDVVVTDIKMPNMDGIAVTQALQEVAPEVRVVILTVYEDVATRAQAEAAGAAAFVAKHEPAEVLLEAIYRAVGERHEEPDHTV